MGEVAVVDADDGGGEVDDAAGVGFVVDFDEVSRPTPWARA
jgi:hypothetical protein